MAAYALTSKLYTEQLAATFESTLGVLELDVNGVILNANAKFLSITGYDIQEVIGKNYYIFWFSEDIMSDYRDRFWTNIVSSEPKPMLHCRKRKDGSTIWLVSSFYTLLSDAGEPVRVIKVAMDISEKMEGWHDRKDELHALDQAAIIAEYSPQRAFTEVNENFIDTMGYSHSAILGRTASALFPADQPGDRLTKRNWQQICSGHTHRQLLAWSSASGKRVWLDSLFAPVFTPDGELKKVIQVSVDVTEKKNEESKKEKLLNFFLMVMSKTSNAVAITDDSNRVQYLNQRFSKLFGYKEKELRGKPLTGILGAARNRFLRKRRQDFVKTGTCHTDELVYGRDGHPIWVSWLSTAVYTKEGVCQHILNFIDDITDHKLHEQLQDKALEGLARNVPIEDVLSVICREVEKIFTGLSVNMVGVEQEQNTYTFASAGQSRILDDLQGIKLGMDNTPAALAVQSGAPVIEHDMRASSYPQEVKDIFAAHQVRSCLAVPVCLGSGKAVASVSFHYTSPRKITDFQIRIAQVVARICAVALETDANRSEVRRLAFYDAVTGLPNRYLLQTTAEHMAILAGRQQPVRPVAVLVINPYRLQQIKSTIGFKANCQLLSDIAKRLHELKSKDDVIGRTDTTEFVMAMSSCNADEALKAAKRIQAALAEPFFILGFEISLQAAVGIGLFPDHGATMEEVMQCATTAMNAGLLNPHENIHIFQTHMETDSKGRVTLESKLRNAIARRELILHFQPQIYMKSGMLYGVEALCRWKDPELGMIPPSRFIPLAEETGLITALNSLVLEKACRQMRLWKDKGLHVPRMAVNLSAACFQGGTVPDNIFACLMEHGLRPEDLVLELTESIFLDADAKIMNTLTRLHEAGIQLSLDDFGTGYSSLSYLHRLPISEIKLDQSFVRNMQGNEVNRRLSGIIARIAEKLHMTVIAEGIETKTHFLLLKEQKYSAGQGYLFSRPLATADFESWLQNWKPSELLDQYCLMETWKYDHPAAS